VTSVRRPILAVTLLAVVALLAGTWGRASAHEPADSALLGGHAEHAVRAVPAPTAQAPPPAQPAGSRIPWAAALSALAGGALLLRRSRRRALAVALVACCAVVSVETAVHAFHHVTDPSGAAACPLYQASHHLSAVDAAGPDAELQNLWSHEFGRPGAEQLPAHRAESTVPGRAPPLHPLA